MEKEEIWVFDKERGRFNPLTIRGSIIPAGYNVILCNAFSLSMLPPKAHCDLLVFRVTEENAKRILKECKWTSAVGHQSTALLLSKRLKISIPTNRITVTLDKKTVLLVAQLLGPRKEFKEMTEEEIEKYPLGFFLIWLE